MLLDLMLLGQKTKHKTGTLIPLLRESSIEIGRYSSTYSSLL